MRLLLGKPAVGLQYALELSGSLPVSNVTLAFESGPLRTNPACDAIQNS